MYNCQGQGSIKKENTWISIRVITMTLTEMQKDSTVVPVSANGSTIQIAHTLPDYTSVCNVVA